VILVVCVLAFVAGLVVGAAGARRHRHAWTLHMTAARVWLECPLCGDTSPGWNLSITQPSPLVHPLDRGAAWPTMILH
jgi:hypothetical protein